MTNPVYDVIVVGGGASGMMAAIAAKKKGVNVLILERNPRVGKKILATGNGRCNFTNIDCDIKYFNGKNPEFAQAALGIFDTSRTLGFFEKLGIFPMIEEGGKVFPRSAQASSILDVLLYEISKLKVKVKCDFFVRDIKKEKSLFKVQGKDESFYAHKVIMACGGKAMPSSGSDGNGFNLSKNLGHKIVDIFPALVQLKLSGRFFPQIQGVKFQGKAQLFSQGQKLAEDFGDILFTNYGISGPPILQLSRQAGSLLQHNRDATLRISIFYDKSKKEMENILQERFKNMQKRPLKDSLIGLINKRLIPVVLKEAGIEKISKPVNTLKPKGIQKVAKLLVDWPFKVVGTLSWQNAQVTAGGVDTDEVNPYTLESKLVEGLYFSGEILDIDGICGGFNLQWAWSSGHVAGENAARAVILSRKSKG